jgi:deoxyribonuclease V
MRNNEVAFEFSFSKARKIQQRLAEKVVTQDRLPKEVRRVAGVDVAYMGSVAFGAVVVLDYGALEVLETRTVICQVQFPYVPTFFAFRELPTLMAGVRKLEIEPDVFLVNGHGRAHPYRCGLASHLGVVLGKPTIGVAKEALIGELEGGFLVDKGEVIEATVTTHEGTRPVYVSVGHMVSLPTAINIVKHCTRQGKFPEPLRMAHEVAVGLRKTQMQPTPNSG